jgi:molybdate transport system regulatory protein
MSRITLRIDLEGHGSIGPGKVRLLELVGESGSIQKAAAAMAMSYAHAWKLVQETGATFGAPLVDATAGGVKGGGTNLTALGRKVVMLYRRAEQQAAKAAQSEIEALKKSAQGRDASRRTIKPKRPAQKREAKSPRA